MVLITETTEHVISLNIKQRCASSSAVPISLLSRPMSEICKLRDMSGWHTYPSGNKFHQVADKRNGQEQTNSSITRYNKLCHFQAQFK
jgi:hypothetical protein